LGIDFQLRQFRDMFSFLSENEVPDALEFIASCFYLVFQSSNCGGKSLIRALNDRELLQYLCPRTLARICQLLDAFEGVFSSFELAHEPVEFSGHLARSVKEQQKGSKIR
jgi:hypothetical protein